jgi:hypothetical protein
MKGFAGPVQCWCSFDSALGRNYQDLAYEIARPEREALSSMQAAKYLIANRKIPPFQAETERAREENQETSASEPSTSRCPGPFSSPTWVREERSYRALCARFSRPRTKRWSEGLTATRDDDIDCRARIDMEHESRLDN